MKGWQIRVILVGIVGLLMFLRGPKIPQEIKRGEEISVLIANPGWYDYLHLMRFAIDGRIEMTDGGGQVINAEIRGHYDFNWTTETSGTLRLSGLVEINPYTGAYVGTLSDMVIPVEREQKAFASVDELQGGRLNPDDYRCHVFYVRYIFETDPLIFARKRQSGNLYNITENRDFENSVKTYYERFGSEELTQGEVKRRDIPIIE